MLNLSMLDVKELRISNKMVREELNSYSIMQIMELRRAKWLQKLAKMPKSRNPRKLFVSWIRTRRPTGRPRQTIRHGYAETIETNLGYGEGNSSFNNWMEDAADPVTWKNRVEGKLELEPGTYKITKLQFQKGTQANNSTIN